MCLTAPGAALCSGAVSVDDLQASDQSTGRICAVVPDAGDTGMFARSIFRPHVATAH